MPTLEPTLAEVVRRALDARLLDVHTGGPGSVVAYYATDHTADVQIGAARAVPTTDNEVKFETLPVLPRVPVLAIGTARSFIQTTLEPGDSVWLFFAESSAAEFLEGQDATQPGDLARFSLSSCVALPFVRPGQASGASALALADLVKSKLDAIIQALQAAAAPTGGGPLVFSVPLPTDTAVATAGVKAK